jgi:hypothetical protein
MDDTDPQQQAGELVAAVRAVNEAARHAAAVLRALAPLRLALDQLGAAAALYEDRSRANPTPPHPEQAGTSRAVGGDGDPDPGLPEYRPATADVAGGGRLLCPPTPRDGSLLGPVALTVERGDGPLDLARLHGALSGVAGVSSVALLSYARGRAHLRVECAAPVADAALLAGLAGAFPDAVTLDRSGPAELVARIGAAPAATR